VTSFNVEGEEGIAMIIGVMYCIFTTLTVGLNCLSCTSSVRVASLLLTTKVSSSEDQRRLPKVPNLAVGKAPVITRVGPGTNH